ncbi:cytochrome P450 [Streptomyces sp. NBC_01618]|uniref:cytochrome P450 n=1 Tax=Streptomyces sp. NBC_01618 TaxID=2975900 RepID=UPI00386EF48D
MRGHTSDVQAARAVLEEDQRVDPAKINRVIRETLRLHHTGWLVTRRTVTQTRLGPWSLPAGTELAYCQHVLHRDPALFPDPLSFNPDRWLEDAQAKAFTPGAYLPFGAGKHKCIGDRFALTELVTAIATIVRRLRFELPPNQTVRPVAEATVRPSTLLMTVHQRNAPAEQKQCSRPVDRPR